MKFLLTLLLFLQGCALVQVAERPETLAGCAAGDVLTTAYSVRAGFAHETNPLLAPSVNAHHFLPMLLSKAAVVALIWWVYEQYRDSQAMKAGVGVATTVTCGVALNNALIITHSLHWRDHGHG